MNVGLMDSFNYTSGHEILAWFCKWPFCSMFRGLNTKKSVAVLLSIIILIYILHISIINIYVVYWPYCHHNDKVDAKDRKCSYDNITQLSRQKETVLHDLSISIEAVMNGLAHSPYVFLLIHQGGDEMTNLVKAIAKQSALCVEQANQLIEMVGDDFTSVSSVNDYGRIVEIYKNKIKRNSVVLIANLNEIPAESAPALHIICDTYNPIAKDVTIFLSLVTPESNENAQAKAESTLNNLWGSKISREYLDPLITRLADHVIELRD